MFAVYHERATETLCDLEAKPSGLPMHHLDEVDLFKIEYGSTIGKAGQVNEAIEDRAASAR